MTGQSLEQQRMADALARIRQLMCLERQSEYLSYVKALPASILWNGLGQAMATLLAAANRKKDDNAKKDNDPHFLLYRNLECWLCGTHEDAPYRGQPDLMEAIVHDDQQHYLLAQAEAQLYLNWLKKFAVAYLEK